LNIVFVNMLEGTEKERQVCLEDSTVTIMI